VFSLPAFVLMVRRGGLLVHARLFDRLTGGHARDSELTSEGVSVAFFKSAALAAAIVCAWSCSAAADEALPKPANFLFWTPAEQAIGYRNIEKIFPVHLVKRGAWVDELPRADPEIALPGAPDYMRTNRVSGLLVIKNGVIAFERYGLGRGPNDRWTSFSVAKSVTATLVGEAIRDGAIKSLNSPVADYIHELKGSAYDGVTVRELLTMSSGVKWNEEYTDPKSDVAVFATKPADKPGDNAIADYMAKLPREAKPGTKFLYKTGESDLIGILVSRATGKTLAGYLSEKIWLPMGAEQDAIWMTDRTGEEIGGCCISMTLRDYGRFGLLMLNHGRVQGRQIVPAHWAKDETTSHIASDWGNYGYGYQWWINPRGGYEAIGIFGQSIFVDPKEQLVVVLNSAWPEADAQPYYVAREAFLAGVVEALHGVHVKAEK